MPLRSQAQRESADAPLPPDGLEQILQLLQQLHIQDAVHLGYAVIQWIYFISSVTGIHIYSQITHWLLFHDLRAAQFCEPIQPV